MCHSPIHTRLTLELSGSSNVVVFGLHKLTIQITLSGGLKTGTPISEHNFGCNVCHHIPTTLHNMDKEVPP